MITFASYSTTSEFSQSLAPCTVIPASYLIGAVMKFFMNSANTSAGDEIDLTMCRAQQGR